MLVFKKEQKSWAKGNYWKKEKVEGKGKTNSLENWKNKQKIGT